MLRSGMLSSFHTAQRCNGKLKNCFSFDHRGLNLFMGPAEMPPPHFSPKETLCIWKNKPESRMTDLSYQMCCSSLGCNVHPKQLSAIAAPFSEELIACVVGGPLSFELNCWLKQLRNNHFLLHSETSIYLFTTSATKSRVLSHALKGKAFCVS